MSARGVNSIPPRVMSGIAITFSRFDTQISDAKIKNIQKIAKNIVNTIPDQVYHRVNLVDYMNMVLKPENTPRRLSASTIFLSEHQLEKGCPRTERDLSIKMTHIGCPIPKIYKSPFKDEKAMFAKEEILKRFMLFELSKKYGKYCTSDIELRDVIIGGNYPEEHEITYINPMTGENLVKNTVEIIASPRMKLWGVRGNLEHLGYPGLLNKVRHETPEDSDEINRFLEGN